MAKGDKGAGKVTKPSNPAENAVFDDLGSRPVAETIISDDRQHAVRDNASEVEMTQIPTSTLQEIVERLNTLEQKEGQVAKEQDSEIFDPLAVVKTGHTARIGFLFNPETGDNDLVLAYKTRRMASGQEKETWLEKDGKTGELRTKCSLICLSPEGKEYLRENLDYVDFLTQLEMVECSIVKRYDVGSPVKQDFTVQRIWNGRQLAPTPVRVQTGYVEQKYEYDVQVDGVIRRFKQNVVNIR